MVPTSEKYYTLSVFDHFMNLTLKGLIRNTWCLNIAQLIYLKYVKERLKHFFVDSNNNQGTSKSTKLY